MLHLNSLNTVNTQILIIEGLHPFYDERVRDLLDFKIYLDISDDVKFAWKIQRDMAERGHTLESIKASIEARKPDFDAYIDPQKQHADVVIQVCMICHPPLPQHTPCLFHRCCPRSSSPMTTRARSCVCA